MPWSRAKESHIDSTTAEESTRVPSISHRSASALLRGACSSAALPDDDHS
jgi:hypothetical protein